jgi:cytochrome c556
MSSMSKRTRLGELLAAVVGLAVVVAGSLVSPGQSAAHAQEAKAAAEKEAPAADAEPSVWMRKKLDYSKEILEGISTADFDQIAKNAEAMRALGKIEAFVRSRTPGYRTQLQIFEEANAEILKQANRDNLEGTALAFTQLTISCVNCHKQLRESDKK